MSVEEFRLKALADAKEAEQFMHVKVGMSKYGEDMAKLAGYVSLLTTKVEELQNALSQVQRALGGPEGDGTYDLHKLSSKLNARPVLKKRTSRQPAAKEE